MANTSKLGLTLINGSDIVDYNTFNNNFNIIDKLGDDYVVEHGNRNPWWYRKWASGRMECGVDNNLKGNATCSTNWGGCFLSNEFSFGAYPVAFTSRPYASVSFNYASSAMAAAAVVQKQISGGSTSPAFYILQPTTGTVNGCQFGIYCTGYWT